jgi:hypothetical protein
MKKGIVIFIIVAIVLVFATFVPSVNAAPYGRYKLVDSFVDGNYKTCVYKNVRGETKSTSINKGKRCPATY